MIKVSRGERNCNPLNIVKGSRWKGLRSEQTDPRFCQFVSMAYGWRAALILIRNYITGVNSAKVRFNTIEKIINRWAPATENHTESYINHVCALTGIHRSTTVYWSDRKTIVEIVWAMADMECGKRFPKYEIESAYNILQ